jgi:hypothetical protein
MRTGVEAAAGRDVSAFGPTSSLKFASQPRPGGTQQALGDSLN